MRAKWAPLLRDAPQAPFQAQETGVAEKKAAAASTGGDQSQAKMDEATEQGFIGVEVDQTPNENYTVAGVTAGLPTPETDADLKKQAEDRADELSADPFADSTSDNG